MQRELQDDNISMVHDRSRVTQSESPPLPAVLVIMGPSGCGKTTIGTLLASAIGCEFADGDWFHPPANVEKMHQAIALTDEDRWPWLRAIADFIDSIRGTGQRAVVACSALKRRYRDIVVNGRSDVRLVYLKGTPALIAGRIANRDHFMPKSLLLSQFAALEEPGPDENPIIVSIDHHPLEIVREILATLRPNDACWQSADSHEGDAG